MWRLLYGEINGLLPIAPPCNFCNPQFSWSILVQTFIAKERDSSQNSLENEESIRICQRDFHLNCREGITMAQTKLSFIECPKWGFKRLDLTKRNILPLEGVVVRKVLFLITIRPL